jgi:hypothetical protein
MQLRSRLSRLLPPLCELRLNQLKLLKPADAPLVAQLTFPPRLEVARTSGAGLHSAFKAHTALVHLNLSH